jgi:F420-non-reducing hydrogenase iron-sulfur subunit
MASNELVFLFLCRALKRKRLLQTIKQDFPSIRVIEVPCIGRFNPILAFKMITSGAKGVLLLGCDPGDCHFREGNLISERRILYAKETLTAFGIHGSRIQAIWYNPGKDKQILHDIKQFLIEIARLPMLTLKPTQKKEG